MECEVSKTKKEFLINALELKLCYLEFFPYVCTGKPCICKVYIAPMHQWAWTHAHINVMTIGCLYSVEWNSGMEWWNGTVEWSSGMEWWNSGMTTPIDRVL